MTGAKGTEFYKIYKAKLTVLSMTPPEFILAFKNRIYSVSASVFHIYWGEKVNFFIFFFKTCKITFKMVKKQSDERKITFMKVEY